MKLPLSIRSTPSGFTIQDSNGRRLCYISKGDRRVDPLALEDEAVEVAKAIARALTKDLEG
jgi:hypothetical protein